MASAPTNNGPKTGYTHIKPSKPGNFQEEGAQSLPNTGGYPTGKGQGDRPAEGLIEVFVASSTEVELVSRGSGSHPLPLFFAEPDVLRDKLRKTQREKRAHSNTLWLARESPRPLWEWELQEIFYRHLSSRWWTLQFHTDRWGRRAREASGIDPHGTIRLTTPMVEEKAWLDFGVVPCGQIPYYPITPAELADPDNLEAEKWIKSPVRGWRGLLEDSVLAGVLRPDPELMTLIGLSPWAVVLPNMSWTGQGKHLPPPVDDPYSPNYRGTNLDWV